MLPLHEHSVWWVLLIVAPALFVVHAMVETTLALLQKPPPRRRNPHSAEQMRAAILAIDVEERPVTISERSPGWAEIIWDPLAGLELDDPTKYRLSTRYRSRFLVDGERREVRLWESMRSTGFYYGFSGAGFRFGGAVSFYWGMVTGPWIGKAVEIVPVFPPRIGEVRPFRVEIGTLKRDLERAARRGGWALRPVIWPFQVHPRFSRLAPGSLRRASRRRVWGISYPLSYALTILAIFAFAGQPDAEGWLALTVNVVVWWSAWTLIAWLLVKKP